MGVSTRIYINRKAPVQAVAKVIGILAGLEPRKQSLGGQNEYWSTKVDGVNVQECKCLPECCSITLTAKDDKVLVDGECSHYVLWHWENERSDFHLICPPSTPFWLTIGMGVLDFFGGEIDFNDCDGSDIDQVVAGRVNLDGIEDGDPWCNFQQAMLDLKPLTAANLLADAHAAYQEMGLMT